MARRKPQAAETDAAADPAAASRWAYPRRASIEFDRGVAVVYSDAHYWPGEPKTVAFRALVKLCRELRPAAVIANGDLIDGAKISRHARIAWSRNPGVFAEVRETQARQNEIQDAAPRAKLLRTVGNHDIRFDNWLAQQAEQFEGLPGMRLADHLPAWPESWSVRVNDTIVKHRMRGGTHAAWNNVLHAGCNIVTGHLHRLEARSARGYEGPRRWGIETGTLAVCPQDLPAEGAGPFEYLEDNPTGWAGGFAVLTWHRGRLLPPEFCAVEDGVAWFRGRRVYGKDT